MGGLLEAIEKAFVKQYRKRMSRRLFEHSDGVVARGPFKGMKLGSLSHLSVGPLALKLFGLYEVEVADVLAGLKGRRTLVNIGAGDGYFSIGMVLAGVVENSVCFELDGKGRDAIRRHAELNGVGARIAIHGAADASLLRKLEQEGVDPAATAVLCDIEGAEFGVLDKALIGHFAETVFVVEVHPFAVSDGAAALAALEQRFAATHRVERVSARPRDWSGIPEIEALNDNARALVVSEGRKELGLWLVARPREA